MLAREQGRWRDHGYLMAGHCRSKGRAHRNLGFAKSDIAANQPVHRLAAGKIFQHFGDDAFLILGFGIGEPVGKGGVGV
jgi:hypothetical protein